MYSGFSHSLKTHIDREKKLLLAQFSTGPRRSGAVAATGAGGGTAGAGRPSGAAVAGLSAAGLAASTGSEGLTGGATGALAGFLGSPAALAAADAAELARFGADAGRAAETAGAAATETAADTSSTGAGAFSLMISASGVARIGTSLATGGGVTTAMAGTGTGTGTGVGADLPPPHSAYPPPIKMTAASAAKMPIFLDDAGFRTSPMGGLSEKAVGAAGEAVAEASGAPGASTTVASIESVTFGWAELAKSGNIESVVRDVLS